MGFVEVAWRASARSQRGWCAGFLITGAFLAGSQTVQASLPVRGMELVSHEGRNFGDVRRVLGASDAGDRVVYITTASADHANSSFLLSATVASRSGTGWTLSSGDPVAPQFTGGVQRIAQTLAVNDGFSKLLLLSYADLVPLDADNGLPDLYLVDVGSGNATLLSGQPGTVDTAPGSDPHFVGASRDLSRIYFTMNNVSLLPGAPAGALYEWNDGQLELASTSGPAAWANSRSGFDTGWLAQAARLAHGGPHAVSDDGSTLFFSGLSARKNGTTVQISASQRAGGPASTATATFVGASHDGNIAYFISADQLTDTATPGGGLYRYTLSNGALALVTPDVGDPSGLSATDANISDDVSHVYFVATAALTPGAQAGAANVYVYDGDVTRLVASTAAGATVQRVSRNGRFAIIQTTGSLGGAPNNGNIALYEYDDLTGDVFCVSCRSDGSPSQGDATLDDNAPAGLSSFPQLSAPRNITDDGHVFFASNDKLVPDDVTAAWDVYEYGDGSLALLSTGHSQYDSYVADNSDDGRDAFFVTRSALVPEADGSGFTNLYDARIGGGFSYTPGVSPAPCAVDCQKAVPTSALPASATSTLLDPGNLDEQPRPEQKRAAISVTPSKAASGTTRSLRVKVSGGGTVRLSGASVTKSARSVSKAGTYTVTASLTAKAKSALKRKHTLKVTALIAFASTGGTSATKRVSLSFKEPSVGRARHGRTSAKEGR